MTETQEFQTVNRRSYKDILNELTNLKKYQFSPKVELIDKENNYIIKMEIPGIENKVFNFEIQNSQFLFISTFKNDSNYNNTEVKKIYSECKYGKINRRVKLPTHVDTNITHSYNNGILTIIVNKLQTHVDKTLDKLMDEDMVLYSSLTNKRWSDDI